MKDAPSSNTEKIVVAKKKNRRRKEEEILCRREMNSWFAMRIPAAGGDKCQVVTLRLGAMSKLGGISIWSVPAAHSNGISAAFAQTAAGVFCVRCALDAGHYHDGDRSRCLIGAVDHLQRTHHIPCAEAAHFQATGERETLFKEELTFSLKFSCLGFCADGHEQV